MTKLEELKAAYEAAIPDEWIVSVPPAMPRSRMVGTGPEGVLGVCQVFGDSEAQAHVTAQFIAHAHNLMPALLEAVCLIKQCQTTFNTVPNFKIPALDSTSYCLASKLDAVLERLQ